METRLQTPATRPCRSDAVTAAVIAWDNLEKMIGEHYIETEKTKND